MCCRRTAKSSFFFLLLTNIRRCQKYNICNWNATVIFYVLSNVCRCQQYTRCNVTMCRFRISALVNICTLDPPCLNNFCSEQKERILKLLPWKYNNLFACFAVVLQVPLSNAIRTVGCSWDVPLIFCLALTQLEFSRHIFKDVSQYDISRKRRAVDAGLFHEEGQTDMTKLIVAFRKAAKSDYWLRYVRPCIHSQGSTRLAMDTFSWHFILGTFWKSVEKIQDSFKSDKYRVIHKSLRNFRTRLRNNQDRHDRKEHINR